MKQEFGVEGLLAGVDQLVLSDTDRLGEVLTTFRRDREISAVRHELARWLSHSADLEKIKTASRETSTHFVWPLYRSRAGFSLVINEFKDPLRMGDGYAKALHNHRYSFASMVLSGGYTQTQSTVTLPDYDDQVNVADAETDHLSEGDMAIVGHEVFHRLITIMDHTVTLLVKSPAFKAYSISIDLATQRLSRHVPVETRLPRLVAALLL
jgi:hypothetical protein